MLQEFVTWFDGLSVDTEWILAMVVIFAVMFVLFYRLLNGKEN